MSPIFDRLGLWPSYSCYPVTELEPQRLNYDAVSELVGRIGPLIEGHSARARELAPVEPLAPEAYTLAVLKAVAAIRDQAEWCARLAVELVHTAGLDISGRQLALAANVSNSTVARWVADPLTYDVDELRVRKV